MDTIESSTRCGECRERCDSMTLDFGLLTLEAGVSPLLCVSQEVLGSPDARMRKVMQRFENSSLGTTGRATPVEVSHKTVDSDIDMGTGSGCNEVEEGDDYMRRMSSSVTCVAAIAWKSITGGGECSSQSWRGHQLADWQCLSHGECQM